MKKISALRNESEHIQSQIRALLVQRYNYENGLTKQLNIIGSVGRLQQKPFCPSQGNIGTANDLNMSNFKCSFSSEECLLIDPKDRPMFF